MSFDTMLTYDKLTGEITGAYGGLAIDLLRDSRTEQITATADIIDSDGNNIGTTTVPVMDPQYGPLNLIVPILDGILYVSTRTKDEVLADTIPDLTIGKQVVHVEEGGIQKEYEIFTGLTVEKNRVLGANGKIEYVEKTRPRIKEEDQSAVLGSIGEVLTGIDFESEDFSFTSFYQYTSTNFKVVDNTLVNKG